MATKELLLALLEENRGVYYSGEELAKQLSVSRAAVWKAINNLRDKGYEIHGAPNKGYCLSDQTDLLSVPGIQKYLAPQCQSLQLTCVSETVSTNTTLLEQAAAGAPQGCVLLAGAQTGGRGRVGKQFFSPRDTGIYLSLLLRPRLCPPGQAIRLTTMAAVAACEALEAVSGRQAAIKWVNDIYLDGRKVCGILTEGALSLESGYLDYAVLGIGMNLYPPRDGFPQELSTIAGAVFETVQSDGKNRLAAEFLNRFLRLYDSPETDYQSAYRERSLVIGQPIQVLSPQGARAATALDVDSDCRLLVEYPDGSREALSSGEISIRPQNTP